MGCLGFDAEDELQAKATSLSTGGSCKRFKIPRKCSDEGNPVNHASIPRKLRSAMKKRSCELISAPLPASKHSTHTMTGGKISKASMKQGDHRKSTSVSITKDEEEVVETLNALAGMFPHNDTTEKINFDGQCSELKSSTMLDASESPKNAVEASFEDSSGLCQSKHGNAADGSFSKEEMPQETAAVNSFSGQCNMGLVSSVPEVELRTHEECKTEPTDENHLNKPSNQREASLETQLKNPSLAAEVAFEPANALGSREEQQQTVSENKKNDPAFWLGSNSARSIASENYGPLHSSSNKVPAWLDSVCDDPAKKVSRVSVDRRRLENRCATHVYIAHIIHGLQIPEMIEKSPVQLNQVRPNVDTLQEILTDGNNLDQLTNGLDGVASSSNENPNEATRKRPQPDQQQSCEFLSLSAGSRRVEANHSASRTVNGLEPSSQFQIPYLQSFMQHRTVVPPLSIPQTSYSSSPYSDELSAAPATLATPAQQLQQISSFPFCGTPNVYPGGLTNQQQQRIWAVQQGIQFMSGGMPSSQVSDWQNGGRSDSSFLLTQSAQPILHSSLSPGGLTSKYMSLNPQQLPQFYAIASPYPPPKEVKRQHLPPRGYEGGPGPLPLQLLCSERL